MQKILIKKIIRHAKWKIFQNECPTSVRLKFKLGLFVFVGPPLLKQVKKNTIYTFARHICNGQPSACLIRPRQAEDFVIRSKTKRSKLVWLFEKRGPWRVIKVLLLRFGGAFWCCPSISQGIFAEWVYLSNSLPFVIPIRFVCSVFAYCAKFLRYSGDRSAERNGGHPKMAIDAVAYQIGFCGRNMRGIPFIFCALR